MCGPALGVAIGVLLVTACGPRRPAPPAPAPGEVAGVVLDSARGWPVEGAAVSLVRRGPAAGAVTDGAGAFRLAAAGPGPDTLLVRRIGYVARRVPVDVPAGGGVAVVVALTVNRSACCFDPITPHRQP